ncbi:MAG: signal recognition particle-docking protein FtsY [Clostridia bacterium]|nr:signal recognition particle-docking protein FtsY [Clostridia bacterium]
MSEKKGFFSRLREGMRRTREGLTRQIDTLFGVYKELDDEFFEDLEATLIQADVGVATSEDVIARLREKIYAERITEPQKARDALKEILSSMMETVPFAPEYPAVILIVGVNGVGKTTAIGKLAGYYRESGRSVMMAAADTFRAAAAEQLTIWSQRAGVPIVKHQEGADPAAVVYDALESFKARHADLLLVDTAGRLHNKTHLIEELRKIRRVIARGCEEAKVYTLMVLDATTGQNGVSQAKVFRDAVDLDGIILTKLDGTAKGGVVFSIKKELDLPVYFVGVGEGIDDLRPFDAENFADAVF